MIISLIGMSNVGKSYWSKIISDKLNYQRFSIDEMIAEKIFEDYGINLADETEMSSWMGQPNQPQYVKNSQIYLQIEDKMTNQVLDSIDRNSAVVIDTTGSLVHLNERTLNKLSQKSRVIHLQNDQSKLEQMITEYIGYKTS